MSVLISGLRLIASDSGETLGLVSSTLPVNLQGREQKNLVSMEVD